MRRRYAIQVNHSREAQAVPIVSDAVMLSVGVAEGRAIPVLILDTSARPDVDDVVRAHEHFGPGDAKTSWASAGIFDRRHLRLVVEFERPQRCVIILQFEISAQGGVVDQIVQSELVYLQPGRPGDRLKNTMDTSRVMVEVPSGEFKRHWDAMWRREAARFFKKHGMSRREVSVAVENLIAEWREVWTRRLKGE
jgi:hypothetical protein